MKKTASTTSNHKIQCACCRNMKDPKEYYRSYNPMHTSGRIPYCKSCVKDMVYKDEEVDVEKLKNLLQQLDRPFLYDVWQSSVEEELESVGGYFKNIAMVQYRSYTWKDSRFGDIQETNKMQNDNKNSLISQEDLSLLQDKWGFGYNSEELIAFEKKYQLLKNNYPEKTAMHTEALLTYIRYRVKEEMATAKGDVKEAKAWGELASKAAQDAKINPNQLSKADLADGLSTFGELTRAVEQAVDIIEILPKFKEKPKDKVDFTIWCYINYIRDMKGLPPCEYKDIYNFYEERKKEYAEHVNKEENVFENEIDEEEIEVGDDNAIIQ